jgi:MFS family permease
MNAADSPRRGELIFDVCADCAQSPCPTVTGFFGAWGSMLGPNMQAVLPAPVAEREAGWMGFWGALAGMAGGILLAVISDQISGSRKKGLLLVCCACATTSFVLFACFCAGVLHVPYGKDSDFSGLLHLIEQGPTPAHYSREHFDIGLSDVLVLILRAVTCVVRIFDRRDAVRELHDPSLLRGAPRMAAIACLGQWVHVRCLTTVITAPMTRGSCADGRRGGVPDL